MNSFLVFFALFSAIFGFEINPCADWFKYEDSKCLKVLEEAGTEEEGRLNCSQLDEQATLLNIESDSEQKFLNNFLVKYNGISANVWLGLKFENSSYDWSAAKDNNFTNWSIYAEKRETLNCVQMTLIENKFLGKWIQRMCSMKALIVCQRKQSLNQKVLIQELKKIQNILSKKLLIIEKQKEFMNKLMNKSVINEELNEEYLELIREDSEEEENQRIHSFIEEKNNSFEEKNQTLEQRVVKIEEELRNLHQNHQDTLSLPKGFVYSQLFNQISPKILFSRNKWIEISSEEDFCCLRNSSSKTIKIWKTIN